MVFCNIIVYKFFVFWYTFCYTYCYFYVFCLLFSGYYIYCGYHLNFLSTDSVNVDSNMLSSHKVMKFEVASFPRYLLFCKEVK